MGLKNKNSIRWRIFLPIVLAMWVIIGILIVFQYQHETEYRKSYINQQLNFINSRIIAAYEQNDDIKPFLNFISNYLDNSVFDQLKISAYDANDQLLYAIGRPFKTPGEATDAISDANGYIRTNAENKVYFYKVTKSDDGNLIIHTAMPWTASISDALRVDNTLLLTIFLFALIAVTILAYFSTSFIVNNIKILREFARNANNPDFKIDESRLGHDELGDISRDILKLYQGRVEANKRSEREHAVAIHAIEEKGRMQHQLTNNINHELKTPVGVIRGYLETVLTSEEMDQETQRYFLQRALDNVERLCTLLNDVSTMTRLENGSGKISFTEINMHDLVYTIHNDLNQAGALNNMDFDLSMPLECTVYANANLLTSAISNLFKNAAIHSRGTSIGMSLVSESEKFYTFSFWDNGQGVSEEHIPHLFERFYRVDAGRSRKSGGTGLGLPIVKNTIDSLGGAISVYNRSKGGLEFLFTLKKAN